MRLGPEAALGEKTAWGEDAQAGLHRVGVKSGTAAAGEESRGAEVPTFRIRGDFTEEGHLNGTEGEWEPAGGHRRRTSPQISKVDYAALRRVDRRQLAGV